jgi:hypothetical protein
MVVVVVEGLIDRLPQDSTFCRRKIVWALGPATRVRVLSRDHTVKVVTIQATIQFKRFLNIFLKIVHRKE